MAERRIPESSDPSKWNRYACFTCGKEFFRLRCAMRKSRRAFCSKACANPNRIKRKRLTIKMRCLVCGRFFWVRPSYAIKAVSCSRKCQAEYVGRFRRKAITSRNDWDARRQSDTWRDMVFNRYGRRCFICGSDYNLEAHHVKPFRTHPELVFKVENGRPVCRDCHRKIEPVPWAVLPHHEPKVIQLRNSGLSFRIIGNLFGVSATSVHHFLSIRGVR